MQSIDQNNILIIRLSSFGDVLIASALPRVIKKQIPNSNISFLVKPVFSQMIENNPNIDSILIFKKENLIDLKKYKFDVIIDLQNNQSSYKICRLFNDTIIHKYKKDRIRRFLFLNFVLNVFNTPIESVSQRYLNVLKNIQIESTDTKPEFFIRSDFKISDYIDHKSKYICIAPGAAHYTKQWPTEKYIDLIHSFSDQYKIVLLGGNAEKDVARQIENECEIHQNFVGITNFNETAGIIKYSQLLICNDSSVMHLAVAVDQKVLVFFGSTSEQFGFFPYDTNYKVLENNNLSCRPCTHIGRKECPKKHLNCLNSINSKTAFNEAINLLEFN